MVLSKELLDVLACPRCKADVKYDKTKNTLQCVTCKKIYKIEDDIPIMLP